MNQEKKLELLALSLKQSKSWVSIYYLLPYYNKRLIKKINELQDLLDTYNWSEQRFYYTLLTPKSTGLPHFILIPDFPIEGSVPYILIPKIGLKSHSKRDHYLKIELCNLDKVNIKLRFFLELNMDLILLKWGQIIDSVDFWKQMRRE